MNKVVLVGRLGADPVLRYTQTKKAVTSLRVATNETWKDQTGKKQTRTEWHSVVVWGPQALTCSDFLRKGSQVLIEGRLTTRENNKIYHTEIISEHIEFLDSRPKTEKPKSAEKETKKQFNMEPDWQDDIPF